MPWPQAYDRAVLTSVDSTNAEAARRAPDLVRPCWILALEQTAARGRRGRPWVSRDGNFAATLLMRPEGAPADAALRSFTAALALYDALVVVTGRTGGLALKWPNDVLLHGGKLAGILLESLSVGPGMQYLAIGIGVNLVAAPGADEVEPGAVAPVDLASTTGALVTPQDLLEALAESFDRYEQQLVTYGFAPIRTAWLERAARVGQPITARTGRDTLTGTFETIDDSGALVLKTSQGRVAVSAADIFF